MSNVSLLDDSEEVAEDQSVSGTLNTHKSKIIVVVV